MESSVFFIKKHQKYLTVFTGLTLFSLFFTWIHYTNNEEKETALTQPVHISDSIPEGFVMIPIELENHEAVSDLVSSHGVVDLYYTSTGATPHKLAQAVRIMRLQTDRFAALVPENKASVFLKLQTAFHAVLQNSQAQGTKIHQLKKKRSIVIDGAL